MRVSVEGDLAYEQVIASYLLLQPDILLWVDLVDGGADDPDGNPVLGENLSEARRTGASFGGCCSCADDGNAFLVDKIDVAAVIDQRHSLVRDCEP